jgi:hypothetical protein
MGPQEKPTADESRRMDRIKEFGCIACWMRLGVHEPCDVHHLVMPGKRYGHRYTIGLCLWHHRGHAGALPGHTRALRGPSLMDGSKLFHGIFGNDEHLWAQQDRAIRWEDGAAWPTSKIVPRRAVA